MIATSRFVFLHLHKSGGTFVNECLLRFIPDARRVGYHLPRSMIPADLVRLPVLGLVRNPWGYYVSWYSFQRVRQRPNVLFQILSRGGRLGFGGTIRNMLALGTGGPLLDSVLEALPMAYDDHGINLPSFALAPIRTSGLGFYSYLYRYMYGSGGAPVHVERVEDLRRTLPLQLERVGEAVSADMHRFLQTEPARNVSSHGPYADHYDLELRDLVDTRDAMIIGTYGYRFGT